MVITFRKYLTFCGPETSTQWKSESINNQWTNLLTGIGVKDAFASRNMSVSFLVKNGGADQFFLMLAHFHWSGKLKMEKDIV